VSTPLCLHFGTCGGCAFQDMPDDAYRAMKREAILHALAQHGLTDSVVADIVEAAPASRRRATFKLAKTGGRTEIGFHAAKSHTIVDLRECRVMTPALTALAAKLREMMNALLHEGEKTELHVTESDTGFDVVIAWKRSPTPKLTAAIAPWAERLNLARVTGNGETLIALRAPTVRLGKASVNLPPDVFLQPTRDGESALQSRVVAALGGAKNTADLFCGCGTFTFPLAERARVHAVERDGAMLRALAAAAQATPGLKPVTTERRDLFRRPLTANELAKFDAVVLDPPRAGASAQVKMLAVSTVPRIVYVSCNPPSFARDARVLVDAGYRLGVVTPVDQFLWSSHIELVTLLERQSRGKR
jgi:23S rRNA (uracil1939-C5)-methyltransferase